MNTEMNNPVIFVGAGPGHPDLITVAGRRALEEADLVVYAGSLVPEEMLTWSRPQAKTVSSAGLNLDEIVEQMAQAHGRDKKVVRLHTGDPSLYGAIREQILALEQRDIAYRIIPGVTAAFAAAAALGVEYTLPEVCQSLIFTRAAGRTPVPEKEDLALLAAHGASMAIYLSAGQAQKVSADLSQAYGPQAPAAVIYRVSWPDEKILWTTAQDLPHDLEQAGITRQALILAGPGVEAVHRGGGITESRLYAANFSHGYRKGEDK